MMPNTALAGVEAMAAMAKTLAAMQAAVDAAEEESAGLQEQLTDLLVNDDIDGREAGPIEEVVNHLSVRVAEVRKTATALVGALRELGG